MRDTVMNPGELGREALTRSTWERVLGLLSLTAAVVAPFTICLFGVILMVALALAWPALLPRLLGGPWCGPAIEALRIALGASVPTAVGLAGVANAGLTPDALPWMVVPAPVAAACGVVAACVVGVAALRLRSASRCELAVGPDREEDR